MDAFATRDLLSFLASVPDPRSRHGRQHPLSAILALVCCAILCGARSYAAIGQWAQDQDITLMHRLGFTRRPPEGGRDPQGLDRPECQGIRARFDPMGRDVVEPPDNRQAVAAGGLRPSPSFLLISTHNA